MGESGDTLSAYVRVKQRHTTGLRPGKPFPSKLQTTYHYRKSMSSLEICQGFPTSKGYHLCWSFPVSPVTYLLAHAPPSPNACGYSSFRLMLQCTEMVHIKVYHSHAAWRLYDIWLTSEINVAILPRVLRGLGMPPT